MTEKRSRVREDVDKLDVISRFTTGSRRRLQLRHSFLHDDLLDRLGRYLGASEPLIESAVFHRESVVVDAQQMQNRRVQIANVDRILEDVVAELVG